VTAWDVRLYADAIASAEASDTVADEEHGARELVTER